LNVLRKLASGQTIAERLAEKKVTTGFDYLRIVLAALVVAWHSMQLSYGDAYYRAFWQSPWRPAAFFVIPCFFTLSGYLVAGSLDRVKSIFEFVMLRVLRIVPALFVEILLSAFILGPLLTTVPLSQYFSSTELYSYFFNVIGYIHYTLPGMFPYNPYPHIVNAQLWTIPYELQCYIALTLTAIVWAFWRHSWNKISLGQDRVVFLVLTLGLNFAAVAYFALAKHHSLLRLFEAANGPMLVMQFLTGVCFHLWRDKIVLNRWLFLGSVVASWLLTIHYQTEYLAILPLAYVTVYLGLLSPPKKWLFGGADFSYGLYLFGWPIQQTFEQLFPQYRFWWACLAFSLVLGLLYAAFSWHCIEKPINDRKKTIIATLQALFSRPLTQPAG
jgi:peptidoglycan/LPS O-acetylase OafA/YrhL